MITLHDSKVFKSIDVPDDGFVQAYSPRLTDGSRQVMVRLEKGEVKIIHFPIVTHKLGKHIVRVSGTSIVAEQTREITIPVSPYGINNRYLTCHLVDLLNHGLLAIPDLQIPVNQKFVLPNQDQLLYVPGSASVEFKTVGGSTGPESWDSSKYLRITTNTGAAYASNLAIHALWLNFFNSQNAVDRSRIQSSLESLAEGIAQSMVYYDYIGDGKGYFAMWLDKKPSIFVTLNTLYALAHFFKNPEWLQQYLFVDLNVVHNATKWLCEQQSSEGSFGELHVSTDDSFRSVIQDKNGRDLNISMTAYALLLLNDISPVLSDNEVSSLLRATVARGLKYISSYIDINDDPFSMAFVTYSLKLNDHFASEIAVKKFMNMSRSSKFISFERLN